MSYAVLPSLLGGWAPCINMERPYSVDYFWAWISESPKFVAGMTIGDNLFCHSVLMEEEPPPSSACNSKHLPTAHGGWYTVQDFLPQLQFRRNHGLLPCRVEI
uniref:Uncharacterized protein n=1 Tax=Rhizophora mucronata TaxID=61149 RepID=A0A2P2KLT9_RHIMU